jgi:hypothetical protein
MIALIPPLRRSVRQVVRQRTVAPVQWAYLGTSIRNTEAVARWIGSGPRKIALSDLLQKTARSLRKAYIDYIGQLGVEHDSPDWWFSSLSEKSPTMSKAFLHICYLAVAVELCRRHKGSGPLVLIVERPEVRHAIAVSLGEANIQFVDVREPSAARLAAAVKGWVEMAKRRTYWICRQFYRMAVSRMLGFSQGVMNGAGEARPWVLLHNWVDARCFTTEGKHWDVYFGQLREKLQKQGVPVAVVGTVPSHAPYGRLLARLKRTGIPLLVPEAALTLQVLLRWIGSLPIKPPRRRARPRFEGFDVSDILAEVERTDWINPRAADVRMTPDIVVQWRRRVVARVFIYPYEGHVWERGYCHAFRMHNPQVKLIGYQHATVSSMWLNHFIAQAEWGKVPFPDRIVTNSPYHYALFLRNGMPESVLACGGAFRYEALGEGMSARSATRPAGSPIRVLVAPSIILTNAAELLFSASEAFHDDQQITIVLKCHPRLPADRVSAEAGLSSLPANFVIDERPIAEVLRAVDVLVYSDSTVALEALAHGVPVVHYSSNHEIDLDPLEDFPDLRSSTGTAQGLRAIVCALAQSDPEARHAMAHRAREVIQTILARPDESTVALFMPDHSQDATPALSGEGQ